jgi:Zn-dependent protease
MNLLIAIVFMVILRFMYTGISPFAMTSVGSIVAEIVQYVVMINLVLMVFNLIPVPPLDGFGIVTEIFDLRKYSWYETVYQYGFFFLLALILFNVTDLILTPLVNGAWRLLASVIMTGI